MQKSSFKYVEILIVNYYFHTLITTAAWSQFNRGNEKYGSPERHFVFIDYGKTLLIVIIKKQIKKTREDEEKTI